MHKQKQSQHKYELTTTNSEVNNIIVDMKKWKKTNDNATIKEKKKDRKKSVRVVTRNKHVKFIFNMKIFYFKKK